MIELKRQDLLMYRYTDSLLPCRNSLIDGSVDAQAPRSDV